MSFTLNFSSQNKSIQLSQKELFDLQSAVTFALNGRGVIKKQFGNVCVETSGSINAFANATNKKQNIPNIETDC